MKNENEILAWLEGDKDYQTGVQLFLKYGKSPNLQRLFLKKQYPEKLEYELNKLVGDKPKIAVEIETKPTQTATTEGEIAVKTDTKPSQKASAEGEKKTKEVEKKAAFKDLPIELQSLIVESNKIHQERELLRKNLMEVPEDNSEGSVRQRSELMQQIKDATAKIDEIQTVRDYFDEHGKMPEPKAEATKEPKKEISIDEACAIFNVDQLIDVKKRLQDKIRQRNTKLQQMEPNAVDQALKKEVEELSTALEKVKTAIKTKRESTESGSDTTA